MAENETTDDEWRAIGHRMIEAIEPVLRDTEWGPGVLGGGMITDVVVLTGWATPDGQYATSFFKSGSPWAAEGLIHDAYQRELERDRVQLRRYEETDE